jgi:hypothetical protein
MRKTIRIAVTGGRDYPNRAMADQVMEKAVTALAGRLLVIVGCCETGLDLYVRDFCDANKHRLQHVVCKADWTKYGKAAGPKRNTVMVMLKPDLLLSFPGGKGTRDMTDQSLGSEKKYGHKIKVEYIKE